VICLAPALILIGNSISILTPKRPWMACCFCLVLSALLIPDDSLAAPAASRVTLNESFQAALKRSEVVADQSELIFQAEEHHKQATGALLPRLSGAASAYIQGAPGANSTTTSSAEQSAVKLTLDQPLFRGFRDFALLKQTKLTVAAQDQLRALAKAHLYNDVASNFFSVLSLERDFANIQDEMKLYDKRIGDLKGRMRIGRSRPSELLTVQASLATLRVQVTQLQGELAANRETFAFLTGLSRDTSLATAEPVSPMAGVVQLSPIETYLSRREERPDMKSADLQIQAALELVSVAKGGHLPSLDLQANYYPVRTGVDRGTGWDAMLTFTVPIFAGGVTQSKVREAASVARQAELNLGKTSRSAETEIRTLYATLVSEKAQLQTLQEAAEISEKNYKVQTHDYRLGLVTNLEVLQALTVSEESKRALDRAYFTAQTDMIKLQTAVASSPYESEK
jgi:outer membrane protein